MTQTDNDALVRCPFCGGAATVTTPLGFGNIRAIECTDIKCGAVGPWRSYENAAVVAWNTRAALRSPAPVVDDLLSASNEELIAQARPLDLPVATRPQPAQDEAFAWVDDLSWHQQAKRAVMASVKLGSWMSAALDDVAVCEAMKADIREWFSAGEPMEILTAAITALRQHREAP